MRACDYVDNLLGVALRLISLYISQRPKPYNFANHFISCLPSRPVSPLNFHALALTCGSKRAYLCWMSKVFFGNWSPIHTFINKVLKGNVSRFCRRGWGRDGMHEFQGRLFISWITSARTSIRQKWQHLYRTLSHIDRIGHRLSLPKNLKIYIANFLELNFLI